MSTESIRETLKHALHLEPFTAADRVFVDLLENDFSETNPFALAAAALCLAAIREGHSKHGDPRPWKAQASVINQLQNHSFSTVNLLSICENISNMKTV